jgi:hypothetical protein
MAPVTRSKGKGSSPKKKPTISKAVSKRFTRRNDKGTRRLDLGFDLTDDHDQVRPFELIQNPTPAPAAAIDHPPPPSTAIIGTRHPPPGFDLTDGHQVRPSFELIQNPAPAPVPVFDLPPPPPPPQEPAAIIGTRRPPPGFDLIDGHQVRVYELIQNPAPPPAAAVFDLTPNAAFCFGFDWTDDQLVRVYERIQSPAQPPATSIDLTPIGKVRFNENGTHPERTDEKQSKRNVKARMGRIRRQLRKAGVSRTKGIFRDTTNNTSSFPVLPKTGTDESVCDGWQPKGGAARSFRSSIPRLIQKHSDEQAVWRGT